VARYEDALSALNPFRVRLQEAVFADIERQPLGTLSAFSAGGASSAFTTPLTNVHATGVGIRVRRGAIVPDDFVIKVYVFEKLALEGATPALTQSFDGIEIDIEPLPVQMAAARSTARTRSGSSRRTASRTAPASTAAITNRSRIRPIPGGVSISPLGARYVGTVGCFVKGVSAGAEQLFALSNNHVMANVNNLPTGTVIVQAGPESAATDPADSFATLSNFLPLQFPTSRFERRTNLFDAAIAQVTDATLIGRGQILGIPNYSVKLTSVVPGMTVTKSGRTTGVTTGTVTGTHVNGVQINYGTQTNPRIAIFDDAIQTVGDGGRPFSLPGDSGSVILERSTGRPIALLFAGDGRSTTACDLGGVCRQFQVIPT
jgi:hypothetical protein